MTTLFSKDWNHSLEFISMEMDSHSAVTNFIQGICRVKKLYSPNMEHRKVGQTNLLHRSSHSSHLSNLKGYLSTLALKLALFKGLKASLFCVCISIFVFYLLYLSLLLLILRLLFLAGSKVLCLF